jgi:hypothetical protein
MGERLLLAYTTLMNKAPGAAFRRARELYLNKYCVPQGTIDHPLRLFVCDEQTDESEAPAPDGQPGHRVGNADQPPRAARHRALATNLSTHAVNARELPRRGMATQR